MYVSTKKFVFHIYMNIKCAKIECQNKCVNRPVYIRRQTPARHSQVLEHTIPNHFPSLMLNQQLCQYISTVSVVEKSRVASFNCSCVAWKD